VRLSLSNLEETGLANLVALVVVVVVDLTSDILSADVAGVAVN
jgi:hypothetical protein